ncbi:IS1380 family transposase [Methylocaldum sp. GT1BB]|uniref:IS1380 family transposase n=1 Tax=Methylocaldum sp. GT1BB TaxID=3438963 RepID=UPI003DA1657C
MTHCTGQIELFAPVARRRIDVAFDGGAVTSDAGVLLLRQVDRKLGLLDSVAQRLKDPRDPSRCAHAVLHLLRQRVYGLCQGYEDLNDHDTWRHDLALQTACERLSPGASSPTLCRLENRMDRAAALAIHEVFVEQFIASFPTPPDQLILDFDATDDPVHGHQEGRFFHGYYDHYCFLPLYVFCGDQLLVSYLRPSKIDAAKHAGAILKALVQRLRAVWPEVKIIFRADSGFCRRRILAWCERHGVGYLVGLAKNNRLLKLAAPWRQAAQTQFAATSEKQRVFGEFAYTAGTWKHPRQVILKAEHGPQGENPRFRVTNLAGDSQALYEDVYCARGDMENRIKEQQLGLFADRTSCHVWWANQFRLLLAALGYLLLEALRRLGLAGTELARAQCSTLRGKLLKIGGVILRNTRRIRFLLPNAYPWQALFWHIAERFAPG